MKPSAAAVLTSFALATATPMARAIEEPRYTVVRAYEGFEVREYAPYLVAEVTVPGPASEAGNQGFRILAGYIFGKNRGERKIEMTAPVTQAAGDGGYVVQFVMPSTFTLDTLPLPDDPRVRLRDVPAARYAVIRYSGTWSDANYQDHLAKLRRAVQDAGLATVGEPVYSRYNGPMTPWFLRRNEIWLPLP